MSKTIYNGDFSNVNGFTLNGDFVSGSDIIQIKGSGFGGGLAPEVLPSKQFVLGAQAIDKNRPLAKP